VGRAPLEGSDDQMLLATLREGAPAPAPSKVMVASAKAFLPAGGAGKEQASAPMRLADQGSSGPGGKGSSSKSSNICFATRAFGQRSAGADLGLMSGRGLY